MNINKVKSGTLSKLLNMNKMKCVPEGIHHINEIYSLVQATYPELCDDTIPCKWQAPQPEWKHRVRNIISGMKRSGRVLKDELSRGYWRISGREEDRYMDEIES